MKKDPNRIWLGPFLIEPTKADNTTVMIITYKTLHCNTIELF